MLRPLPSRPDDGEKDGLTEESFHFQVEPAIRTRGRNFKHDVLKEKRRILRETARSESTHNGFELGLLDRSAFEVENFVRHLAPELLVRAFASRFLRT